MESLGAFVHSSESNLRLRLQHPVRVQIFTILVMSIWDMSSDRVAWFNGERNEWKGGKHCMYYLAIKL